MNILTIAIIALAYPLLVIARVLNFTCGRDPLRLREPRSESCWIPRAAQPDTESYFSEESVAEGKGHGGFGGFVQQLLKLLGQLYLPGHSAPGDKLSSAADREQGIPDEVYTLW